MPDLLARATSTVPRRTRPRTAQRRTAALERVKTSRRSLPATQEVDAQVLALREGGCSFSAIARQLELHRAVDAHRSFVRALGAFNANDRRHLVESEVGRLDLLEERIRTRDVADPEKVERRLIGVDIFREALRQ